VSHSIFVYGTLKHGESQAALLTGLERQPARVRGRLYHLPAGYPALVLGGDQDVHGELVAAPDPRLLQLLDDYEGVGQGLYRRELVRCVMGLRSELAWAWVMDDAEAHGGRFLPRGTWSDPRRRW